MKILFLFFAAICLPLTINLNDQYRFTDQSEISIEGTSTLHDWTMEAESVDGRADIEVSDGQILSINQAQLRIPVESLKSGKSRLDNNAYEALKSNQHPNIVFTLRDFQEARQNGNQQAMKVTGDLTIAGQTRQETIPVEYRTDSAGNLYVSGSKDIKMTDYGITPPEVMFGTIKTGNEITINIDLHLKRQ